MQVLWIGANYLIYSRTRTQAEQPYTIRDEFVYKILMLIKTPDGTASSLLSEFNSWQWINFLLSDESMIFSNFWSGLVHHLVIFNKTVFNVPLIAMLCKICIFPVINNLSHCMCVSNSMFVFFIFVFLCISSRRILEKWLFYIFKKLLSDHAPNIYNGHSLYAITTGYIYVFFL